jgi:opacity protein-like surface antigen
MPVFKLMMVVIITILPTLSYASEKTYVRVVGGVSKASNHVESSYIKSDITASNIHKTFKKTDSSNSTGSGYAEIAIGYNFTNSFRADISYTHLFNLDSKIITKEEMLDKSWKILPSVMNTAKTKFNINTLMVNGFMDFYTIEPISLYVGLGVGASLISAKTESTIALGANIPKQVNLNLHQYKAQGSKSQTNLALAGHIGLSILAAEDTYIDLVYNYVFLGGVKVTASQKINLMAHNFGAGVRFNF